MELPSTLANMIVLAHAVLDFADMELPANTQAESLLRTGKSHANGGNYEAAHTCIQKALIHAAREASVEDLKMMVIEMSYLLPEGC